REAGVAVRTVGIELRSQIEGDKTAIYRQGGRDYDVRVRARPDQRDLATSFNSISVPNVNNQLVPLRMIAKAKQDRSPSEILRENRAKYVQISADINPTGPGLGRAMAEIGEMAKQMNPPTGVEVTFVGQAERFQELVTNIAVSLGLGIFFIYLILVSLYESFITPFTIMLVIPLAACGAFIALFIAQRGLDLYSMIGCVTLMGLATKNSILIVDYTEHQRKAGKGRVEALVEAGRVRLRPILMTSFAMIAGMVPVAIGLNEASRPRKGLGIAIIGGTVSSTVLTLVVIPAAFLFIDRFEHWFRKHFNRYVRGVGPDGHVIDQSGAPTNGHGEKSDAASKGASLAHSPDHSPDHSS
ncbi:MAG: efflux RND transporter permease subunit, partial [Alphaproteobacteria bacterium]